MGHNESNFKRQDHSTIYLHQKNLKKPQTDNLNTLEGSRKTWNNITQKE